MVNRALAGLGLVAGMAFGWSQTTAQSDYEARELKFRAKEEADLKAPQSWLSLAGLFWLKEGDNAIGADHGDPVRLPDGEAPPEIGDINVADGKAILSVVAGSNVQVDGWPVKTHVMAADADGKPDIAKIGSLSFEIIRRGKRVGVRLWDTHSKVLRDFKGLRWYPIDPAYRVKAKFTAYPQPLMLSITNVLGDSQPVPHGGFVTFTLHGKTLKLDAQVSDDGLFFDFADSTTGKSTNLDGRFLDAAPPVNGVVDLDFNEAVNPPCAFTPFATCPLPPPDNVLDVAIPAGEKAYK